MSYVRISRVAPVAWTASWFVRGLQVWTEHVKPQYKDLSCDDETIRRCACTVLACAEEDSLAEFPPMPAWWRDKKAKDIVRET